MYIMAMNFKIKVPKFLKSVKFTLAAVNGVFVLTGALLLAVGISILVINSQYEELITQQFFNIPGFVVATGVIILLASVLGFYSAISENFLFVAGYGGLMLLVLIFEIAIVVAGYALKNGAASSIRSTMRNSLQQYSSRLEVARVWDDLQRGFGCCGVEGRHDYISNQIPVSCCHIDYGTISPFECNTANAYTDGCAGKLGEWLSYNAEVIAISALVVTIIQVLLTAMSGWMAWRTKFEEVEFES